MLANTPDRLSSDGDGDAAVVATEPAARSKDTDRLKDAGECLNETLYAQLAHVRARQPFGLARRVSLRFFRHSISGSSMLEHWRW